MRGDINFKFYSDSKTYESIALSVNNVIGLIRISGNEFGPVLISKFIGPKNYTHIFIFNLLVFLGSIKLYLKDKNINKIKFLLLLLICPITFTSLFAINKEIFLFLGIALLLRYIETKSLKWLLFAFIVSLIVRWQFILFLIIVAITFSKINFLNKKRWLYLILFLGATSIVLSIIKNLLFIDIFNKFLGSINNKGLFFKIMTIQDNYGYIIAFIPKVLHLLVGMTIRVSHLFNPDPVEMYNDVVLYWQGPINLFLIFLIIRNKLFKIKDTHLFIIFIYLIVFGITPVYNIRYFYPVTIIMSLIVSKNKDYNEPQLNTQI